MNLLKDLALVSHSFLQICSKHLFATIEIDDAVLMKYCSSKAVTEFLKLLERRPDVVKNIRSLLYKVSGANWYGEQLSPKIRVFCAFNSSLVTMKLIQAKMQDSRPAFNFMDLRQLSMSIACIDDEPNFRYLLQNAKFLEKLHLSVGPFRCGTLTGFLSLNARTLKALDLSIPLYSTGINRLPLGGFREELEKNGWI